MSLANVMLPQLTGLAGLARVFTSPNSIKTRVQMLTLRYTLKEQRYWPPHSQCSSPDFSNRTCNPTK